MNKINDVVTDVISMGIGETSQSTLDMVIENCNNAKEYFPEWVCMVYVPTDTSDEIRDVLVAEDIIVRSVDNDFTDLWKYYVMNEYPSKRYIVREYDDMFTGRDKLMIDEWVESGKLFLLKHCKTQEGLAPITFGGVTNKSSEYFNWVRNWVDTKEPGEYDGDEYFEAHVHHHIRSSDDCLVLDDDIDVNREYFNYPPLKDDEPLNFITVMNGYTSTEDKIMCNGWFNFVRKYHPNDNIIVYHHDDMHPDLIRDDVEYKRLDLTGVPVVAGFAHKRVKLAVHREWVKYDHFIFMDADAYPLRSMREMFNQCRIPITICGHDWQHDLLNSGVFIQRENNFNSDDLITVLKENNGRVKYPGTDQALVRMYFDKIGYNPHDYEVMNQEYNSNSDVSSIEVIDDEVVAISKYSNRRLNVIHGYGCFKFWKCDKTTEFWKYIISVNKRESK